MRSVGCVVKVIERELKGYNAAFRRSMAFLMMSKAGDGLDEPVREAVACLWQSHSKVRVRSS